MTCVFDVHTETVPHGHYDRGGKPLEVGPPLKQEEFSFSRFPGKGTIEAAACTSKELVSLTGGRKSVSPKINHLFYAVQQAYSNHYPLILSPDHIWHTISLGFATHIKNNAEELRSRFVSHEGKKKIIVEEPYFVKNSKDNPWADSTLDKFLAALKEEVGEGLGNLFAKKFTTTESIELAAATVSMMDGLQEYFSYECHTKCGIPYIGLEGTVDDWKDLRQRVQVLAEYDLQWWTEHLEPVIDQFVLASEGKVNLDFWKRIYKEDNSSGGPYSTGWITTLFPYLKDHRTKEFTAKSTLLNWQEERIFSGLTAGRIPPSFSVAPFLWKYFEQEFNMEFIAGTIGISQDRETMAIKPEMAWGVREVAL